MLTIDWVLIALVLVSALIGVLRGFVREALSLATWVLAIWAAFVFGAQAGQWLGDWIADPAIRLWAGRVLVLVGVLLAGSVAGALIGYLVSRTVLTGANRMLGMLFGVARGVVVVALIVLVLELAGFDGEPWWQESKLIPYAAPLGELLRTSAERGLEMINGQPPGDIRPDGI